MPLSPETKAAIEEGLDDIRSGRAFMRNGTAEVTTL